MRAEDDEEEQRERVRKRRKRERERERERERTRERPEYQAGNSNRSQLRQGAPEVATVSLGSVEAGVCGGEVSCGLALIPVVVAEAEAAKAIAKAVVGEEVGPGEAAGSSDFVRRRCKLHPHSHFHLPLLRSPRILPYGSDKFGSVRQRPPGGLSTA